MENPFETGHIKNYIMFYVAIVVIMILFFIASTLFNDVKSVDKKVFNADAGKTLREIRETKPIEQNTYKKFKLLNNAY